jgi:hypothetical protein
MTLYSSGKGLYPGLFSCYNLFVGQGEASLTGRVEGSVKMGKKFF